MRKQLLQSGQNMAIESPNFFQYPKAGSKDGMGMPFFSRPYSVMRSDKMMPQQQQLSPAPQSSSSILRQENKFYPNYPFYSPVEYFSPGDVLRTSGSAGYNSQRSQTQLQQQVPPDNEYTREGAAAAPLFWSVLSDTQKSAPVASQVIIAPPVSPYHLPRAAGDSALPVLRPSDDDIRLWNRRPPYVDPDRMNPQRIQFPDVRALDQETTTHATPAERDNKAKASNKVQADSNAGRESASASKPVSSIVSHRESHETPIAVSYLRDGDQSGRDTNSAVIALTLGLSITAMLIGIVGCRMKSIRKKIARRGGRSLAHDADYLINGMYL
jgi:hypothetical protein